MKISENNPIPTISNLTILLSYIGYLFRVLVLHIHHLIHCYLFRVFVLYTVHHLIHICLPVQGVCTTAFTILYTAICSGCFYYIQFTTLYIYILLFRVFVLQLHHLMFRMFVLHIHHLMFRVFVLNIHHLIHRLSVKGICSTHSPPHVQGVCTTRSPVRTTLCPICASSTQSAPP